MTVIDDIEDIGKDDTVANSKRLTHNDVIVRIKKRVKSVNFDTDDGTLIDRNDVQSFIPETYKIYIKTWGCTHNNSDSEYMAGLLAANGYKIVNDSSNSDLWLLNSCTVKNPSEDHFRNAINECHENGKMVVVAGCVPQSAPKNGYLKDLSIVGVQQIDRVVEVVEETLKGNVVRLMAMKKEGKRKAGGSSLHLPKIRRNPLIEIIPINTGCLNQCTYCKTKHARGHLGSYSIEDIVLRAKESFKEGVKEIWLTSEDTGAYGRDIGTNLPQLLYALIEVIPDDCMLRIGMTNPPYILEHLDAITDILSHPRVYSFLHIPVQSGSDEVLADMKREYCIEEFSLIVETLRKKIPEITIATDIICGFPTETEQNFDETMNLIDKYKFPVLYINQFYPRPGTPAAKMKRVATNEVKKRSKRLTEYFESYLPYEKRIGLKEKILVTEESHDKQYYVGHNKFYHQILIPKNKIYLGEMIEVEIITSGKHHMFGSPLNKRSFLLNRLTSLMSDSYNLKSVWFVTCTVLLCSSLFIKLWSTLAY